MNKKPVALASIVLFLVVILLGGTVTAIKPPPQQTNTARVKTTITPTLSPSATVTRPVITPSQTVTVPTSGTSRATSTAIQPSETVPPSGGHDPSRWHAPAFGHEHGDNPNSSEMVALFGVAGEIWNGLGNSNIGVPFATSALENTMKHPMAKYYTMTPAQLDAVGYPCGVGVATDNGDGGPKHCVRAWRILAHGNANLMEALTNNHSIFVEIQACKVANPADCFIHRSGGWVFYGKLQAPFYNQVFERPGGVINIGGMTMTFASDVSDLAAINSPNTVFDNWGGEPYWFMFPRLNGTFDVLAYARNNPNAAIGDQISSNEIGQNYHADCAPFPVGSLCGNRLFHIAIRLWDGWNLLDASNINNPIFICTQIAPANCLYDGTKRGMKEAQFWTDSNHDQKPYDTDSRVGYVSLNQFTDRYQRFLPPGTCTAIGVDCVPFVLEGAAVGFAGLQTQVGLFQPGIDRDYCPDGCGINFPN